MAELLLEQRVIALERQVSDLATREDIRLLGEQIAQQGAGMRAEVSALRDEMRGGFSELRNEMVAGDGKLREEMQGGFAEVRNEMQGGFSKLRDEMRDDVGGLLERRTVEILAVVAAGDEETRRVLRDEIRAGDEETRRQMRVLHEDLVERISKLHG